MLLGMSEAALGMLAQHKSAQAASTVGDMIARYQVLTADDVAAVLDASASVVGSADFERQGVIILTSASKSSKSLKPVVSWQCTGGGRLPATSKIGAVGGEAKLPGAIGMDDGDNIIVAEVFYQYENAISFFFPKNLDYYNVSSFRPRLGALTSAPGCR